MVSSPTEIDINFNYADYDKVIKEADQMIALDPKLTEGHYKKARALLGKGMIEEAQNQFDKA